MLSHSRRGERRDVCGFGDFWFDCLANVRWTKAYKQMAVEVYLLCTIYVRGSWSR